MTLLSELRPKVRKESTTHQHCSWLIASSWMRHTHTHTRALLAFLQVIGLDLVANGVVVVEIAAPSLDLLANGPIKLVVVLVIVTTKENSKQLSQVEIVGIGIEAQSSTVVQVHVQL